MRKLWKGKKWKVNNLAYGDALIKRPLLTKSVTTCIIYGAGDSFAQLLTKGEKPFDYLRMIRQGAFGLCLLGPFYHKYFGIVDFIVPIKGTTGVFAKLLFDQTIGASLIITGEGFILIFRIFSLEFFN